MSTLGVGVVGVVVVVGTVGGVVVVVIIGTVDGVVVVIVGDWTVVVVGVVSSVLSFR